MLNKIFSVLAVILLVGTSSCSQAQNAQKSNDDNSNMVERQSATIDQQGDYFFIMFDNEPNARYLDSKMEEPFCINKMRVIISGEKLPIPPNVRMAGRPFKVTMIEKDGGVGGENKNDITAPPLIKDEGIVKKKGDTFIIETTETIYVPNNLADNYQREGTSVAFTAKKLPMPPYVRMIGQPIEIVTINTSKKAKSFKDANKGRIKSRTKIK
ncbi:MAG: hypothetical protein AB8B69_08830 [Chitinophagales bacterium]